MINGISDEKILFTVLEAYGQNIEKQLPTETDNDYASPEEKLALLLELLPKITKKAYLLNTIGISLFQMNRLSEAIVYMKQAVSIDPHITQYKCNLGLFYYRMGDIEKAIKSISDVDILWLKGTSPMQELYDLYDAQEAFHEEVLKILLDEDPESVYVLNNLASFYSETEKYRDAIDCYKRILELNPENFSSLTNIALLSMQLGDKSRARLYFLKALKLDSSNYLILRILVRMYLVDEDYQRALTILDQSLVHYPDEPDVLLDLAYVTANLNQDDKATDFLQKCLNIAPEYFLRIDRESIFHPLLKNLDVKS